MYLCRVKLCCTWFFSWVDNVDSAAVTFKLNRFYAKLRTFLLNKTRLHPMPLHIVVHNFVIKHFIAFEGVTALWFSSSRPTLAMHNGINCIKAAAVVRSLFFSGAYFYISNSEGLFRSLISIFWIKTAHIFEQLWCSAFLINAEHHIYFLLSSDLPEQNKVKWLPLLGSYVWELAPYNGKKPVQLHLFKVCVSPSRWAGGWGWTEASTFQAGGFTHVRTRYFYFSHIRNKYPKVGSTGS